MSRSNTKRPGAPEARLDEAKKQIELASDDINSPSDICDLAEAMEIVERVQASVQEGSL